MVLLLVGVITAGRDVWMIDVLTFILLVCLSVSRIIKKTTSQICINFWKRLTQFEAFFSVVIIVYPENIVRTLMRKCRCTCDIFGNLFIIFK